jgi:hypothetical protein
VFLTCGVEGRENARMRIAGKGPAGSVTWRMHTCRKERWDGRTCIGSSGRRPTATSGEAFEGEGWFCYRANVCAQDDGTHLFWTLV